MNPTEVVVLEAPGSLEGSVGMLERRGGSAKYITTQETPREGGSPISSEVTVDIYIISDRLDVPNGVISFIDDERARWAFRPVKDAD